MEYSIIASKLVVACKPVGSPLLKQDLVVVGEMMGKEAGGKQLV